MHSNGIVFHVLALVSGAIRVCKSAKSFHLSIIVGANEGVTHPGSGHAEAGLPPVAPLTGENVTGYAVVLAESVANSVSRLTCQRFS